MDYKRITIIVLILLAVTVISLITTFILVSYYHIGEDENIYLRFSYFMMVFTCNLALMINIITFIYLQIDKRKK